MRNTVPNLGHAQITPQGWMDVWMKLWTDENGHLREEEYPSMAYQQRRDRFGRPTRAGDRRGGGRKKDSVHPYIIFYIQR